MALREVDIKNVSGPLMPHKVQCDVSNPFCISRNNMYICIYKIINYSFTAVVVVH